MMPTIPIRGEPMKKSLVTAVGSLLMLAALVSTGHSQKPDKVAVFMRAKLQHSQKVIEGLATEDFDLIAKSAQEMSLLSHATTWQVLQTPEYNQHSLEFRRSADALHEAAKNKNLDGAALAYVGVTLNCVNCHKYVRRVKAADVDDADASIGR
jgi:hypothetical protein